MIKAIVFDFDGVLCESVEVKTEAFRKLFLDYPDHLDEIIAYHMDKGGISRYKKFDYIFKHIIKKPLSTETSERLGLKFSEYAYIEVVKAPFVDGAESFLKKFYMRKKLYIASGTPEDEMVSIVKEKKIDHFFAEVYGSPKTKYDIIAHILKNEKLDPEEVIFVGDAITDYEGAQQAGVRFIGRIHEKYDDPFKSDKVYAKIKNLNGFEELLREMERNA